VAAEGLIDGVTAVPVTLGGVTAPIRALTATIPSGLAVGVHTVSVRSQDALGNWGSPASIALNVVSAGPITSNVIAKPNPNNGKLPLDSTNQVVRVSATMASTGSTVSGAEGFIDAPPASVSVRGFPFVASDGVWNGATETGYGDIPLTTINALSTGNHTIYVRGKDAAGNWGATATANPPLLIDKTAPTFRSIKVNPASTTSGGGTVTVTVSGSVTDALSGIDTASGTYTMTDSKSTAVVNGTFTINADGSFSFSRDISRSNPGRNNPANRRYFTFTLFVKDKAGNTGSTTAQFYVQ
jgi:hypothetical protein